MRALLIEFDLQTGRRAGNISPKDKNLPCYGWQNLDSIPPIEIRLVKDDRDLTQYEEIKGITVLNNDLEIEDAIKSNIPPQYKIVDMSLMIEHMKEKGLSLDILVGKTGREIVEYAYSQGLAGVFIKKARTLSSI